MSSIDELILLNSTMDTGFDEVDGHSRSRRKSRGTSSNGSHISLEERQHLSPNNTHHQETTHQQTNNRKQRDLESADNDAESIVPPKKRPPLVNPETDDDADDDDKFIPRTPNENPGVDDGFFVGPRLGDDDPDDHSVTPHNNGGPKLNPPNGHVPHDPRGSRRPSMDQPFPYAPGFTPSIIIEDGNFSPRIIPDVNEYQHKKTIAQGMMDIALFTANANQLRYVLESYHRHPYYWFSVVFISISLILQVAVGIGLIWNSRYNVKNDDDICKADRINNFTVLGIFLITIVNVFIASFGVASPTREM